MKKLIAVVAACVVMVGASAEAGQAFRFVLPAAASTEGVGDSYWRTDLVVHNPSDRPAEIILELLPSGFAGAMGELETATLPSPVGPGETAVAADVMGSFFPEHDTGALVVTARDGDQAPVEVVVASRTWTPAPEGPGTLGQGIPGVAWAQDGDLDAVERVVTGLERSEAFRTNLGIVNPTNTIQEIFEVEIIDADGSSRGTLYYNLGPQAHFQRNNILRDLELEGGGYSAVVRLIDWNDLAPGSRPSAPPDFVVYGSRVDERSNDPSYLEGQAEIQKWGQARHRVVLATASTPGAGGTLWTSELAIHYSPEQPYGFLIIELIPTGGEGIGEERPERAQLIVGPGETTVIPDVLAEHFADHEVAALVVQSVAGNQGPGDIRVDSRTATPEPGGAGTMGQGIPGVPRLSAAEPLVIPGLESSSDYRSNLGLVNLSRNLRGTFQVEIYDAAGVSRGSRSYTLEPWSHRQVNQILGLLGLEGSGYTAVVRMTASENLYYHESESWDPMVLAYGSMVDRRSGDPTFLTAVPLVGEPPGGRGDWYDFSTDAPWYRCPAEPFPEEATVVRAFDQAYHWFGAQNNRSIVEQVDFPTEKTSWNQVGLWLHLECPENGLCDHWDRTGSLQLVLNPQDPEDEWRYLEIMRHITPYRVEMCQYVDITPLAGLLAGEQTLVSWIDTWVGPGHSDGEGWRISFDFVFYPGEPRAADEVIDIWGRRSITVGYIEPDRNVDSQIEPVEVMIPADASRVEAHLTTTGHSFGNTDNCAEFCVMRQDLWVNGERRSVVPWRTDCEHNPVRDQLGTWLYDRNGWCPGAIVIGDTIDITDLVTPGQINVIDFDIRNHDGSEYHNTAPANLDPIEWISLELNVYRE